MHADILCSKFTFMVKPRLCKLFSTLPPSCSSSLLLWEFVHDKIHKFALRKRGMVAKLASLTSTCIGAIAVVTVLSGVTYKGGKRVILCCFDRCVDPFASFAYLLNKRIYYRRLNCNNSYLKVHCLYIECSQSPIFPCVCCHRSPSSLPSGILYSHQFSLA